MGYHALLHGFDFEVSGPTDGCNDRVVQPDSCLLNEAFRVFGAALGGTVDFELQDDVAQLVRHIDHALHYLRRLVRARAGLDRDARNSLHRAGNTP